MMARALLKLWATPPASPPRAPSPRRAETVPHVIGKRPARIVPLIPRPDRPPSGNRQPRQPHAGRRAEAGLEVVPRDAAGGQAQQGAVGLGPANGAGLSA